MYTREAASVLGADSVLTQYGLADTMLDPVFDMAGAIISRSGGQHTSRMSSVPFGSNSNSGAPTATSWLEGNFM